LCGRGDKRFVWLSVELNLVAGYLQGNVRGGLKFPFWKCRERPGMGGKSVRSLCREDNCIFVAGGDCQGANTRRDKGN